MARIRVLAVLAAAAAAATLAGCSGATQSPSPSDSGSTPPSAEPSVGHGSLAYCLNEHGVSAGPGPVIGPPPGVDQKTWDEAMSACSSLAPGPSS